MFIDRAKNVSSNSVRRSGIQLELHRSGTTPLLGTEPQDGPLRSIDISPLNGVKQFSYPTNTLK
jgi:hypothetical protein